MRIYFHQNATAADVEQRLFKPFYAMLTAAKNGVDVELSEHKHRRSTAQNAFYWSNMTDVAVVLNEAGCGYGEYRIPYTAEVVHEINKTIFGQKTTTKMAVAEFSAYMTAVFDFWIERTRGFFVPKESAESYLDRSGYLKGE